MKRFEVHRSRPYRGEDPPPQLSFIVTADRFEHRGSGWVVLIDANNNDVAIFNQNEITGIVAVDDVAAVPITGFSARPISDLA